MKLAVNGVVHAINQAVSEALVVAESAGIARSDAYDVLAAGAVGAPFVHYKQAAFLDPDGTPVAFTLDLVAKDLGRKLVEVPVGFKWFVDGLVDGSLGFGGEESAGASFLRRDGTVWTTDKDGIVCCLLAAEMTARRGADPGAQYRELTARFGDPAYRRVDAPATPEQKAVLKRLSAGDVQASELAGEPITIVLTEAPANGAALGGVKVVTRNCWFAARPSGTEDV